SLMTALCEGKTKIDVFDLNDGCRLLFSMHADEPFAEATFSEDGAYAVGRTESGSYVIGDLFADEEALVERLRTFAAGSE
ncbi:MAG: hypothetical protein IKR43_07200, partial [Lachnospiraceae bacterium]|nr:hypothetical protein [Lachnospiraceae bacterium]